MIAITLNFKSLDAARQALLEIPQSALIGGPDAEVPAPKPAPVVKATASGPATAKASAAQPKTAEEKAPAAASAEAPSQPSTAADPKPQGSSGSSPKPSASAAVDYAQVGAAITAFAARNGRDATLAKLGAFGVKSGKELKPEQYADVLAAFTGIEEA